MSRLHLVYVFLFAFSANSRCSEIRSRSSEINLAVILPEEEINLSQDPCLSISRVKPLVDSAVDGLNRNASMLPGNKLVLQYSDSQCSDIYGPLAAMDIYYRKQAHVLFGPCCKYALSPIARFTAVWQVPIITLGGLTPAFSNKREYPLLTRMMAPYDKLAYFLVQMISHYNWTHTSLLWHNNVFNVSMGDSECYQVMDAYIRTIRSFHDPIRYAEPHKEYFDEAYMDLFDFHAIMDAIKNSSRGEKLYFNYCLFSLVLKPIIGGALRPRLYGKLFWNVHSPDGHVRNPEAGLNIILYSDWL